MLSKAFNDKNEFAYLRIKAVNLKQQQNFVKKRTVRGGGALETLRLYRLEVWKHAMLEAWLAGITC